MPSPTNLLAGRDVVILAGGLGTRIVSVLGDTPKLLAPIAGGTLLDRMLDRLAAQGADRVVLALGHRAEAILRHLADRPPPVPTVPVTESAPMGTAGALRGLRRILRPGGAVVMNGDTLTDADLSRLVARRRAQDSIAALLCVEVRDARRFGRLRLDADGFIERFAEKTDEEGPGLINAGVYDLSDRLLNDIAAGEGASLERDYFQRLTPGRLATERMNGRFVDIGTPDGLEEGRRLFGAVA